MKTKRSSNPNDDIVVLRNAIKKIGANAKNCFFLRVAVYNNHSDIVSMLITEGADIHYDNDIALTIAAKFGFEECATVLVNAGATITNDAMTMAVKNNHINIVKLFMKNGANVSDHVITLALASDGLDLINAVTRKN